jgi:SRSO17 transposase
MGTETAGETPQAERQVDLVAALTAAAAEVPAVTARIGRRFARAEARQRAEVYLRGLLSPLERKNGWQLAEAAGDATPYATQHLLGRADWDPEVVRDDLIAYVVEHLGDAGAILVLDETGFVKKGTHSAGVAKQDTGTVGKIENAQVGVFLAYASPRGTCLLDRALYLPEDWAAARARRVQAGIPEDVAFATKPALARQLLERAWRAGVPAAWVTADSIYGADRRLRMALEARPQAYVLAVSGKEYGNVAATWTQRRVSTLLKAGQAVPADRWQRLSAGAGAKGPRLYDWYRLPLVPPLAEGYERWFLVRRSVSEPDEGQAFVVFAPQDTPLQEQVRVAGRRWSIEAAFAAAKGEVGLDQYEVRSWTGWYRHITLALFALAILTVIRTTLPAVTGAHGGKRGRTQQAALAHPPPHSLQRFRQQRRARAAPTRPRAAPTRPRRPPAPVAHPPAHRADSTDGA